MKKHEDYCSRGVMILSSHDSIRKSILNSRYNSISILYVKKEVNISIIAISQTTTVGWILYKYSQPTLE